MSCNGSAAVSDPGPPTTVRKTAASSTLKNRDPVSPKPGCSGIKKIQKNAKR